MINDTSIMIRESIISAIAPSIPVIIGTLIGFVGSFFTTTYIEYRRAKREEKSIAYSFKGEITALLSIITYRRYLSLLEEFIKHMEDNDEIVTFTIPIEREYFNVYNSHVGDVGLLEPEISTNIALFYTYANAILDDFISLNNGLRSEYSHQQYLEYYKEMRELLRLCITTGEKIISQINRVYPK